MTASTVVAIVVGVILAVIGPQLSQDEGSLGSGIQVGHASGEAAEALDQLPVKGRAPTTGYDRVARFGEAWSDVDRNGCDTRNDILFRDLENVRLDERCHVLSGVLHSPYSGETVAFRRGVDTSADVQIDHVVALQNAWVTGAQELDEEVRLSLANDPLNLIAVDGGSNQQKSALDAASWLPADKDFRCAYVARQIGVKASYGLWVTQAESDAMRRVLAACPGQQIPDAADEASLALTD